MGQRDVPRDAAPDSRHGYSGFVPIARLRESKLAEVPSEPGVYLILRDSDDPPTILETTTASDPPYPLGGLRERWVAHRIVYIGRAGGTGLKSTLRSRLRAYLRHGAGRQARHRGGRAIWQLADSEDLLVAWRLTLPEEPRAVKKAMSVEFVARHGKRPFANTTG